MGASAPLTVGEMLTRTTEFLRKKGSASPRLDAELLISDALGLTRLELYTHHDRPVTPAERDAARGPVSRRGTREPIAYIRGTRAFRNLNLRVTPAVLVPRPETELLVEWVTGLAAEGASVCDWGTGSGAIAIALADERPDLTLTGIDISDRAIEVARGNADQANVTVEFVVSDGFARIPDHRFDVVVANPPYLSEAEGDAAEPELAYEPRAALVAGPKGDEDIRRLCRDAPAHLNAGGYLVMEIGDTQGHVALQHLRDAGFADVELRQDLAGLDRAVAGRIAG